MTTDYVTVHGISDPWRVSRGEVQGADYWDRKTRLTLYRGDVVVGVVEYALLREVDAAAGDLRAMVFTYEALRVAELARIQAEKEAGL